MHTIHEHGQDQVFFSLSSVRSYMEQSGNSVSILSAIYLQCRCNYGDLSINFVFFVFGEMAG